MPITGGEADKLGNSYEALWTVRCFLLILAGQARSIYLEPFGEEGEGAEFILTRNDGTREYHQVKRQHAGGWKLSSMVVVLNNFKARLDADSSARCVFVSQDEPSDLREICENVHHSPDVTQFERNYLGTSERSGNFANLKRYWADCSSAEAFTLVRRLVVAGSSETTLREDIEDRASARVDGLSANVISALWQLAFDSIHKTLYATEIWAFLEHRDRGFLRRNWNGNPELLHLIAEANERYLSPIRASDILGSKIQRRESQQALEMLRADNGRQGVLIAGDAGSGKTGVVAEVIELAQQEGWLTLAFRLDRLDASAKTARQLGQQLDFPDSPVTVLAGVTGDQPCLLVIDQLDAVSQTSGRHPAFFERVEELTRQCRRHRNMRLLLSCRHFDLQNDDRLRRLTDEKVGIAQPLTVHHLDEDVVRQVVSQCGVDPAKLTAKQLSFLSTPLHLKVFTEVKGDLTFETLKDLYDIFWQVKRDALTDRLGRRPQWIKLFDRILERMVHEQTLSVRESLMEEECLEDLNALLTERVLVKQDKYISFFHETFFDYVFARRFVEQEQRLPTFLLGQEQHLFLRGIVRQVLTHERDEDRALYLSDLREILENQNIRFHLKRMVFQWLRSLPHPINEEWLVVQSLATSADNDVARWSQTVVNSSVWFNLLDSTGWIQTELDSGDDTRVQYAVNYVSWHARDVPERVGALALEWIGKPEPWPQYATNVLNYADVDKSRVFVDVYLRLRELGRVSLDNPPFSSSGGTEIFYDLPQKQPTWAIEVFEEWLINLIEERHQQGYKNPFQYKRRGYSHTVGGLHDRMDLMVKNAPALFVERMLPIVLELVRRNALREREKPWPDSIWRWHFKNSHHRLDEQLIEALIEGLQHLAVHDVNTFVNHVQMLKGYLDFETAGWILARAYAANGKIFADDAAAFLLSSTEWLQQGWTDSSCWASRELIASVTPHCSKELYDSLETSVLNYYPLWERMNTQSLGYTQLTLLNGFAVSRRSSVLNRRLGELHRKFKQKDTEPPRGIRSGFVGAPFSACWEKLTDSQWLKAIEKYHSERHRNDHFFNGGARELASVLQQQTQTHPARFARLLTRIPDNSNPVYAEDILWGLGKAEKIKPQLVWDALRYCHRLPNRPHGRAISSALRPYDSENFPEDILELIGRYATEDPDPGQECWLASEGKPPYYGGDASHAGLNSVRGSMAWPIAALLFEHPEYFTFFEPYLERMVADPSIAVRTQVAYSLLPVLNIDRNKAVSLFLSLCEPLYPALLEGHFVVDFLSYALWTHFGEVKHIIEAMLYSGNEKTMRCGAQLVTLAHFSQPEAEPLFPSCLSGAEKMRLGVAEVVATRLLNTPDRTKCAQVLVQLFNDESNEVRSAATHCFRDMDGVQLEHFYDLVSQFIESKSFAREAHDFFEALDKALVPLPDVVCSEFEKSAGLMRGVSSGETIRTGRFADRNAHVLVRLYERTDDVNIKRRCLDIIDSLARTEAAYDLEQTLTTRDM